MHSLFECCRLVFQWKTRSPLNEKWWNSARSNCLIYLQKLACVSKETFWIISGSEMLSDKWNRAWNRSAGFQILQKLKSIFSSLSWGNSWASQIDKGINNAYAKMEEKMLSEIGGIRKFRENSYLKNPRGDQIEFSQWDHKSNKT